MRYISTRGGIAPVSFKEAVMMGLATDGGLLLPESLPELSAAEVASLPALDYRQLAYKIISLFATDLPADDLRDLIDRSYSTFTHPEITPLVQFKDLFILELFHGPTLAFKDVALQFLGNLFEYMLRESGGVMNILGATSGDTGSAAIYGVRGKERIHIYIIHPYKRVSPVQELQMTTVTDSNVHNLAIRGTFDDGQAIVKAIFNDIPFKNEFHLGAVNSINWARILAQVVYYIYASLRVHEATGAAQVDFSVPTGNFGDIFAGYVARRLLPGRIRNLVLATNANDLLSRFVLRGDYSVGEVVATSSPSMDIQLASNFERYLYYLNREDAHKTRADMEQFAACGSLQFNAGQQETIQRDFASRSVSESVIINTIASFYQENGYILDPHTAVGVQAGLDCREPKIPMVCLATAHPAKFADAVARGIGHPVELPASLNDLDRRESRCDVLEADVDLVKQYIRRHGPGKDHE